MSVHVQRSDYPPTTLSAATTPAATTTPAAATTTAAATTLSSAINFFKNSLDKHWAENPPNVRVNW